MTTKDDDLSEQQRLVLEYLQARRTLTPMIALISLGIGSLTSRVAELRRLRNPDGTRRYIIGDKWCKDHHERRYKTYWLGDKEPEEHQEPTNADAV
jgi:hypothetical protein